jgi:copper(I)-binding protein
MSLSIRAAARAAFARLGRTLGGNCIPNCLLFALTAVLAVPALAQDYRIGALEVRAPWARATPPSAMAGGGYLTIVNLGTTPDRLIAARSAASDKVEIHEMKMDGNVMRMRELEKGLEIPPGATVTLAPGGYHIMWMGLRAPLVEATTVPVTLVFEKAGSLDVPFSVQRVGTGQPGHAKH